MPGRAHPVLGRVLRDWLALVVWVVAWGLPASAGHAQPLDDAGADANGAPDAELGAEALEPDDGPRRQAGDRQAAVVFIEPAESDELATAGLGDALLAQFALVDAQLLFSRPDPLAQDLAGQITHARELAELHGAVAVFWVAAADDGGRWLLHMMDPVGDRLAMRTVEADREALSAAVEAVAVIARESTRALLAGEEVESQPLPPTPPPPAPPEAQPPPQPQGDSLPPPRYVTRLSLGYEGTAFAARHFQSGLAIGVGVRAQHSLYGGVGITATSPIEVHDRLQFEISRLPIRAHGGYEHRVGPARLAAELAVGLDILTRETPSEQPGIPAELATVSPEADDTRFTWVLAPRLRAELPLVPPVGLYALLGLDVLLNHFDYVSRPATGVQLLDPHPVRPLLGFGLAFYP